MNADNVATQPPATEDWLSRLDDYLRPILGCGTVRKLTKLSVGQSNPTFFIDADAGSFVLRKKPPGDLLPSAHAIDREFRVLRALFDDGRVPVPEVLHYCEDASVIGTPFYVMRRLFGRVFTNGALAEVPVAQRRDYYRAFADALARLHSVDVDAAGLTDFGKSGNYFGRQVRRWSGQWQTLSAESDNPALDEVDAWLQANLPDSSGHGIVHGDFKWDNLIFHAERPQVIGIIDWELSTLGDPMADVAYASMPWHVPANRFGGVADLDLAAEGLPTADEFLADYQAVAGDGAALTTAQLVFAIYRFAVIVEGVGARGRRGNASSGDAQEVGRLGRVYAEAALRLIS